MIENFITTCKKDIQDIQNLSPNFSRFSKDNEKIMLIGIRALSCLGMAFGASLLVGSVVCLLAQPLLGIAGMITGIFILVFHHDLFQLASYRTDLIDHPIKNTLSTIFNTFRNSSSVPTELKKATENTFLIRGWQCLLSTHKMNNYFFSIYAI